MLQRLGFPAIGDNRRFVTALLVDAVGSGVFLPVSILYFLAATPLSLVMIGLALSVASALQLPMAPLLGWLVDTVGAKRMLLAANALEAVGFVGYVFANSFVSVLVAAAFVQIGVTAFWGSYSPMVASISAESERERWFGFLGAARNVSFAVGGLVAALAITIGTVAAYTAVVVVNASSYVGAFLLLLAVPVRRPPGPSTTASAGSGEGWGQVLRDRGYLLLVVTNFTFALAALSLNVAMPVYFTHTLGLPGWVAGLAFTVNTVLIGLAQGLVVTAMGGGVRARMVAIGSLLYGTSFAVLLGASWVGVVAGVVVVLLGIVLYTGGEMVSGPVLTALSTDAAAAHLRGRYISLYQMSWTLAMTVAPVLLTWLLDRGAEALWSVMIASSVVGVVLAGVLRRVLPRAATAVPVTPASTA